MKFVQRRRDRGSLLMAMMAALAVSGIVALLAGVAMNTQLTSRHNRDFTEALNVAESGLTETLFEVNAAAAAAEASDTSEPAGLAGSGDIEGNPYTWEASRTGTATWNVRVTGQVHGVDRTIEAVLKKDIVFHIAGFGDRGVALRGNNSASSYPNGGQGYVGTNQILRGQGTSTSVDAYMLFGPDADLDCTGGACPEFEDGTCVANCERQYPDPVNFDTGFIDQAFGVCADNGVSPTEFRSSAFAGELVAEPTLGFYCATDVHFDTPTTVAPGERVFIFATGEITSTPSNGGAVNCGGGDRDACDEPESINLQVFTKTSETVGFQNQTAFAGGIFAPYATCAGTRSNAQVDIYGSLICGDMSNRGGWDFHYDEQFAEGEKSDVYTIVTWREEFGDDSSF